MLSNVPLGFMGISDGVVSLKQLERFFDLEELLRLSESSRATVNQDMQSAAHGVDAFPPGGSIPASLGGCCTRA